MTTLERLQQEVFPLVAATARLIHRPAFKKGLTVVAHGDQLDNIVTDLDLSASDALLNGIPELGLTGLATLLPGSFSEEHDDPRRRDALEIWQIDPMDGSGDAKVIGMSPTVLVTLLKRKFTSAWFQPVGALVYDVFGDYALVSDGYAVRLGVSGPRGEWQSIYLDFTSSNWQVGNVIRLPHRIAYLQRNAHEAFPNFLRGKGYCLEQVLTGGAGYQTLQLMRSLVTPRHPIDCPAFYGIPSVHAIPNFQPDWKTWDVDPLMVLARAVARLVSIWERMEPPNASYARDLKHGVVYTGGCMVAVTNELQKILMESAVEFGLERLREKDY